MVLTNGSPPRRVNRLPCAPLRPAQSAGQAYLPVSFGPTIAGTVILQRQILRPVGLAALIFCATAHRTYAAPPYVLDDAGTQGRGGWQLELIVELERNSYSADTGSGPVRRETRASSFFPALTYGLLDNLDVAVVATHLHVHTTEDGALVDDAYGRGDTTLELKWRFYEADGFSLAFKPGVIVPTGDENEGLGLGKPSLGASLILAYDTGPWSLLANAGYRRVSYALPADDAAGRSDLWAVSGGFAYGFAEHLRLVGELGVRTNPWRNDPVYAPPMGQFAMLGLIHSTPRFGFGAGARKALNSGEPNISYLAGVAFRW